jgi:murein DD-endopeptidase MepM/ murein hydrolase activator NlpD
LSSLGRLALAFAGVNDIAKRHPRSVTAALVLVLGGCAATAFGIAPLAPDAADLPQRLVSEMITIDGIDAQLQALAEHELQLMRSDLTRASDTADSLLKRLGVADAVAASFLRTDPVARRVLEGRAGKMVQVRTGEDGLLDELVARYPAERAEQAASHFVRLTLVRRDGRLSARAEAVPLESQVRLASGTVRTSLFAATDESHIPDAIASQLAEMFSTDIDFHRELKRGDTFSVVYEALTADGEPITWNQGTGRVLAAEFVNNGRAHQAVWFRDATGRGGYFGFDGQSKRRSFLASPMEFSRVTSGFAMRFHPLLQKWRQHLGVDYAAPTGAPVRSVGDGVVDFAGWQNGYGNVVQVRHANDRTTLYAHLSRIEVKKGQRVEQSQRVGAVGSTGWATGPHLHFEIRVKGQHQNPLSVAKASEAVVIDAASRPRFAEIAQSAKVQLQVAESLTGSRGYGE